MTLKNIIENRKKLKNLISEDENKAIKLINSLSHIEDSYREITKDNFKYVLLYRNIIPGFPYTFKYIGEKISRSPERCRQIEAKALRILFRGEKCLT